MATSSNLEFINRESELGYLLRRLENADTAPALVVVRSPAGFGKSSLTDRLEEAAKQLGRSFCAVDPNVRGRTGSVSPHDGFFLQRIAEQLDQRPQEGDAPWRRFSNYLSSRRWKSASEKSAFDIVADVPTPEGIYKLAFDYISRAFFLGNFSAKNLLASDQAHAVTLCSGYVNAALAETPSIVVVRQAHHIDLHSLRALLQMNATRPGPDVIFEYTADDGRFEPEHQKLFLRAADERRAMEILDLVRLEPHHLELLICKYVHSDFTMTSDYYLAWSGDLRSVIELKCKVAVGQSITSGKQIGRALGISPKRPQITSASCHPSNASSLRRCSLTLKASTGLRCRPRCWPSIRAPRKAPWPRRSNGSKACTSFSLSPVEAYASAMKPSRAP